MNLYHFCPLHCLLPILDQGITKGMTPINFKGKTALVLKQQWLTKYKGFDQTFCETSSLPYDRAQVRLKVSIPEGCYPNLYNYRSYALWLGENKLEFFDKLDDGTFDKAVLDWYVYMGDIPPNWITKQDFKK
jgi:hypothetical protein